LIINKLLVDPSIQSLNRFTDNIDKLEALSIEIATILKGSAQGPKSLLTKDISPWLPSETTHAKAAVPRDASRSKKSSRPRKGSSALHKADTEDAVRPTLTTPPVQLLPVSRELFSRYNREEIYEKLWKTPFQDVANEYGLAYDTLRKTCERLWIPIPGRSYLGKKAAGQPVVPQPPLPKVQVERTKEATGTKSGSCGEGSRMPGPTAVS
jgi:hypothetical protein